MTARQRTKETIQQRVRLSEALLDRMNVTRDQYERIALNALLSTPQLAKCDADTVDQAIRECIEMELVPDRRQAAVLPYGKAARLVPMIEGRLLLARRATPGISLRARVVYEDDEFEYEEGMFPVLFHKPSPTADQRPEKVVAAYAISVMPGSPVVRTRVEELRQPVSLEGVEWEWMWRVELDRRRLKSPSQARAGSPWNTDFAEMCKKTVFGPLLKRLPKVPGQPRSDGYSNDGDGWVVDALGSVPQLPDPVHVPDEPPPPDEPPADDAPPPPADTASRKPKPKAKAKNGKGKQARVVEVDADAPVGNGKNGTGEKPQPPKSPF